MAFRGGPLVVIVVLGFLFFARLIVQPTGLLYSDYSDFLTYHIPCKHFLVRSWQQTGELPLWCPEMFAGMPFIHDPQVSAFYPPHVILYFLPVEHVGAALSWLVVLHVIAAGLCMYLYARQRELKPAGALVAALGFMFAGKWLVHLLLAGHINVAPLAFLPLLLLFLEEAIAKRSLLRATAAGGIYALILLGTHPQMTIYGGLFAALWTLPVALAETDRAQRRKAIAWWLGLGICTVIVAALLCAIQILPALEATSQSSRTLGVGLSLEFLARGLRTLIGLIGPPLTTDSGWLWEDRGAFGIVWVALAAAGPILLPRLRAHAWITLGWLVLSLGGAAIFQVVPGFHLWRLYSRMLLMLTFPVALFAGATTQALFDEGAAELRASFRTILLKTTAWVLVPLGFYALLQGITGHTFQVPYYWLSLPITVTAMCWLMGPQRALPRPAIWLALLVVDLWAIGLPWVRVRSEAEVYAPSACVRWLKDGEHPGDRIMDVSPSNMPICVTPLWPNEAMVVGLNPVRGYNPLDILRYKEYLQFLMNRDEPLAALGSNFTLPEPPWVPIENQSLADLLRMRYLLVPADFPLEKVLPSAKARQAWTKVSEDPAPWGYSFVPSGAETLDSGIRRLPPYDVYENREALPEAFVVENASPLAERSRVLEQLRTTDFWSRVLLEGYDPEAPDALRVDNASGRRNAHVKERTPNRVVLEVAKLSGGFLVLTDNWFPGWTCTVDGAPVKIYRANFLFRAVELPPGKHEVVFTFAPRSYEIGKIISAVSLTLLCIAAFAWLCFYTVRRNRNTPVEGS